MISKRKQNTYSFACLGGGIGTVRVIRGLRNTGGFINVIASMADDGGSGGRLRRLFSIPPPGDLINCLSALSDAEPVLKRLLTYRFEGDRWGRDDSIRGQKLGNLILAALTKMFGDFNTALDQAHRIFSCHGRILPASKENVSIWALTKDGQKIIGEEKIDRGLYDGSRQLQEIHLEPANVTASKDVLKAIEKADLIIAGPGDLYTTILPVLLIRAISKQIRQSSARKVFVINIANKPFETPNYAVSDYIKAIENHLGDFPFDTIIVNLNQKPLIPKEFNYQYVYFDRNNIESSIKIITADLVDIKFPLYHDSQKLAQELVSLL